MLAAIIGTCTSTYLMISVTADQPVHRHLKESCIQDRDMSFTHERSSQKLADLERVNLTQLTRKVLIYVQHVTINKTSLINIQTQVKGTRDRERLTYFFFPNFTLQLYAHVNVKHIHLPSNEPRQQYGNTINQNNAPQQPQVNHIVSYIVNLNVFQGPFLFYFFVCKCHTS